MRQGSVNYEPGRFGNGVRIDSTFPGYFLLDESLINSMILRGRGTIALWVKTEWPSTAAQGSSHMFFDTDQGGGPERMSMGHWGENDNVVTIGFFPERACNSAWQISLPGTFSDHGIHFQAGEWHHWAMVWDNAGINGTSDLFRFYFDGALALVGGAGCPVTSTLPPSRANYFGRHNWDFVHADAVLDNLIIYDVAKTDFSDRFNEAPAGPLNDANTATGLRALFRNTTGRLNTATGAWALSHSTTGEANTATGAEALYHNTTGDFNTATGTWALVANTWGFENTAIGVGALDANTTGHKNLALGHWAGSKLVSGDQNIYLGNQGEENESNTLRLGEEQTRAFIAGVRGTSVVGNTVLIDGNGQLGTLVSSARYKQDIEPLGGQGEKLQQLQTVMFHYKQSPRGPLQYGLIAEDVAKVYPELVTRNAKGEVEGVRYDELTSLLLNEVQRQQQQLKIQAQQLAEMKAQHAQEQAQQQQEIVALKAALEHQNATVAARIAQLEAAAARTATLAER